MTETAENKETATVKLYDFKSNILLQPDELKTIKHISEVFADSLSLSFGALFKREFSVKYRETAVNKLSQALKKINMPVVKAKMIVDGVESDFFMQIDRNVSYLISDAFLGGDSKKADDRTEITDIEEKMLQKICGRIMTHFVKALPAGIKFSFEIQEVIKKAENFELRTLNDLITTIIYDLFFAGNQGGIIFGFPSFMLDPIIKKNEKKPKQYEIPKASDEMAARAVRIKDVEVECRVVLSGVNIKLKDIIDIQVGDCVTLDHDIHKPLTVFIGGHEKFNAMPGLKGNKISVKVTGAIKGGN
jgi:flagellar motor switch protein FliM